MPALDTTSTALGRSPTVLVIEKDVLIRTSVSGYLRECGFKVMEATSAEEALAILQSGAPVDVVFSDVGQGGDGFGIAKWVRRQRPDAKMILTSGLKRCTQEAGKLCRDGPHKAVPYDHAQLERRIRQLLATRSDQ